MKKMTKTLSNLRLIACAAVLATTASSAFAEDSCAAQVTALMPAAEALTDAAMKTKALDLLAEATMEAEVEADEPHCLKILAEAKLLVEAK